MHRPNPSENSAFDSLWNKNKLIRTCFFRQGL